VDPFSEAARMELLKMLIASGRRTEAEQQFAVAVRVIRELGTNAEAGVIRGWNEIKARKHPANDLARESHIDSLPSAATAAPSPSVADHEHRAPAQLVGRSQEWDQLIRLLDLATAQRQSKVVLLTGEPGMGKTRLIEDIMAVARKHGMRVFFGRSYETERENPYGPWIEAIGRLSLTDSGGQEKSAALPMKEGESGSQASREALFAWVSQAVFKPDDPERPVLLALDDIQWCDEASANLLHLLIRRNRQRALAVILAARDGELADNPSVLGVLRSLRHDRVLQEMRLSALTADQTKELVRAVAGDADAHKVATQCGGNPLFAIELARDIHRRSTDLPQSLKELVRDRLEHLPKGADLLRWASVIGPSFAVERLLPLTPLNLDEVMERLELLERHALLRAADDAGKSDFYRFSHDLIHRAVYTGISEPRRRLMHLKIARSLQELHASDESLAADIAHHAALGGDPGMAAAACVRAGRRNLRLFANAEAEAMARNGLRYAEALSEPDRVQRLLELHQIELLARRPAEPTQAIEQIEALAERALDYGCTAHARLGFHMLSYLRWEGGRWSDAERDTLRAELVSRSADQKQRAVAMAEAARCLAMLERDLVLAETMALEASSLANRLGIEKNAIDDAIGMLRLHQGEFDVAAEKFKRARDLARRDGDRGAEFLALEHHVALEIQRARFREAEALCAELTALAGKLRTGSEAPFAAALQAICRLARKDETAQKDLEEAVAALRVVDAKHQLAFTLLCAAELDLDAGHCARAKERAVEALRMATVLERPSEIVVAHATLARIARAQGDQVNRQRHIAVLRESQELPVSSYARERLAAVISAEHSRSGRTLQRQEQNSLTLRGTPSVRRAQNIEC
jgi:predicted ATPase